MNDLLINKYKPKNIDDFLISHTNKYLLNSYITNRHYYLIFEGESGCGKSSLINIIINKYYGNNKYLINNNVCYITLLKDQGINFYKNDVKIFINNCKNNNYNKFIIIEDVELFSEIVQLYFLELIKNHKNNVFFILSTSNVLKINCNFIDILDTIKFNIINNNYLSHILNTILENEKMTIENNIKEYIINLSNNSINNLINNIEKLILLYDNIEYLKEVNIINTESNIILNNYNIFIDCCKNKNKVQALDFMLDLLNKGYSIIDILENFLFYIKNINKEILNEKKYLLIKIIINYINNYFTIEEDNIEIIFFVNSVYELLS